MCAPGPFLEELRLLAGGPALGPAEHELSLGAAETNFFHSVLAVSAVVADRRRGIFLFDALDANIGLNAFLARFDHGLVVLQLQFVFTGLQGRPADRGWLEKGYSIRLSRHCGSGCQSCESQQ